MKKAIRFYSLFAAVLVLGITACGWADVSPGDTITKDNLAKAEELLSPFVRWLVEQGMPIPIIETKKVNWPKAYKEATEKYAGQVKLSPMGRIYSTMWLGVPFLL